MLTAAERWGLAGAAGFIAAWILVVFQRNPAGWTAAVIIFTASLILGAISLTKE